MKTIEISYNGEWLGYPVHLRENENPDVWLLEHMKNTDAKLGWRYWNNGK